MEERGTIIGCDNELVLAGIILLTVSIFKTSPVVSGIVQTVGKEFNLIT